MVRQRKFTIKTTKGQTKWDWTFTFDNGPILTPFAYKISKFGGDVTSFSVHILNWKQDPPPEQEDRNLEALEKSYEMEFVYMDIQAQLPIAQFFPYNNLEEICREYDQRRILSNRMLDLLDRIFRHASQIPNTTKFKWDKDLTLCYKQEFNRDQMFRYAYSNSHELRLSVPAGFQVPKEYKGKTHPELTAIPGRNMTVIWRIIPSKDNQKMFTQRGFPKYILEKKLFPNSEPVFSKE
jgi:hypothetical protein